MRNKLLLIMLILAIPVLGIAQNFNDNRNCQIVETNEIITIAEVFEPSSLSIEAAFDSLVSIESLSNHQFIIKSESQQKIEVCYRVLPSELTGPIKLLNSLKYDSSAAFRPVKPGQAQYQAKRDQLFAMGEINHGGQITRGITVGNTQDLFVNSSLNLTLDGQLSNDLFIRASITDQYIPYQPEGNTQQLQDFDNVFVELYNNDFSVTGGDLIYQNQGTHFLKYMKNVQGGAVNINLEDMSTGVGISAAKGQFASVNIEVSEGMQGPYKIPSVNGDQFLIIIANSERVYLDGKPLARGFDRDYIIDYNQAEISFTSNIVITKYSRIRVDYEYSSRYYGRSIMNVNHAQQIGNLNVLASYYRESDNKNTPLLYDLSDADKLLLASVGNNTDSAIVLSATLVPFSEDKILYVLVDTIDSNLERQKIFRRSVNTADSVYAVTFSEVGQGIGSYSIKEYLAQGRVYEWVGQGEGNYEPYRKLIAPTKKEMLNVRLGLDVGNYSEVYLESAFSAQDLNLYSSIDNEDNQGYAFKAGYMITERPIDIISGASLSLYSDIEFLDHNFKAIDRFRSVEFDRDWGYVNTDTIATYDMVLRSGIKLQKDRHNGISYNLNLRQKEEHLSGSQHELELKKSFGKIQASFDGFHMKSMLRTGLSSWNKVYSDIYYRGVIQPGYRFILQQNLVKNANDSVLSSANYFTTHEFYLRNSENSKTKFELAYTVREDRTPVNGELKMADMSDNIRVRLNQSFQNGHNMAVVFNYRLLSSSLVTDDALESISGRVDWSGNLINNIFRHELNYSVANVRVPKREYVFVEVPTGEGTHTWRDDNQDGIKDLDEFYEAIFFDERNFVKMYVNTTEFHDAYENNFNYRATLTMPRTWRNTSGVLKLLGKVSNTTSWSSNYRTTENNIQARLIPFIADIDENQILSLREALRTTFFINKSNPGFGMSFGYARFRKKYLYTNGFEGRSDQELNATVRVNIARRYNLKLTTVNARRFNRSDYLAGRNYDINDYKIGPSFSWQPKPTLRLSTTYNVGLKYSSNAVEDPSTSNLNEILAEIKLGKASKYTINGSIRYSRLEYDGDEFTPLGYEMLQGFRPGDNISWQLGWQQKLIAGLQLNLFYEGRKPESTAVIHSGRASVSALF